MPGEFIPVVFEYTLLLRIQSTLKTMNFTLFTRFNKGFLTLGFHLMGIALALPAFAQDNVSPAQSEPAVRPMEYLEGHYVPDLRDMQEKSPAYRVFSADIFTVQVNVDESGNNIVGDAANEPSITFDPTNPDRMAIGWRQFNTIGNSFRQAGIGYTNDGGLNWTFPGAIDAGVFRSDPVLRCDAEGNFYYNSLTASGGDYWCNVFKSEDGGASWDNGVFAQGGDKQWMSIDRSSSIGSGNIYAFWTGAYSICYPDFFTRSTDGNQSYEDCTSIPGSPYWGTTVVSSNGDLYVAGIQWSGFMVAKSTSAKDPGQVPAWDYSNFVSLDGDAVGFGGYSCPNPVGLLGQTIIGVDTSGGANDGNLYLLCSVERNSSPDPLDVMFSRSTDDGQTWSLPMKINDDAGTSAWQWFGTMSVAPDGRIDVVWLDTRDNPGSVLSALYFSYSLDGGLTWTANERVSESFDPHLGWPQQDKMGDYLDMFSDEDGAHLAWAATFNGEQDVYYSLIKPKYVGLNDETTSISGKISVSYPNPFKEKTTISYRLEETEFVSLKVFNSSGEEVVQLVSSMMNKGIHRVVFDGTGLPGGVYYYQLRTENRSETGKMVLAK